MSVQIYDLCCNYCNGGLEYRMARVHMVYAVWRWYRIVHGMNLINGIFTNSPNSISNNPLPEEGFHFSACTFCVSLDLQIVLILILRNILRNPQDNGTKSV
jgi:hypothetical protein